MSDADQRVASGEAWAEFCDAMKRAGDQILRPETPRRLWQR